MLSNFPKIECPFIRKEFDVDKNDFRLFGKKYMLRAPRAYLVTPEINKGYEWVLEDPETFAVEKLDGSNVKLRTENGRLVELQNRKNVIDPLQIVKGKTFILNGVFEAIGKGYIKQDGVQAGELIGKKVQGNPYNLNAHLWYPFTKAIKHLRYRSFHEHERTFENWSLWFRDYLFSRFMMKKGYPKVMAEGVIFYNLKRKSEGKSYMAKLRRDMFKWFYEKDIQIYGYSEKTS